MEKINAMVDKLSNKPQSQEVKSSKATSTSSRSGNVLPIFTDLIKPSSSSNDDAMDEESLKLCPTLTRTQRMWGFGCCFCVGYLVSFFATFALMSNRNTTKFGIFYSLGNIIALCGSGFLVGPMKQITLMMMPVRRVAAFVYLSMIILVLVVAIQAPHLTLIILLLAFIQFVAGVWYSASYVPYGRKIIKATCKTLCGMEV